MTVGVETAVVVVDALVELVDVVVPLANVDVDVKVIVDVVKDVIVVVVVVVVVALTPTLLDQTKKSQEMIIKFIFNLQFSTKSITIVCVAAPHVAPSKPPQLPSPMSGRNVTTPAPPLEQSHGSPLRLIA